MIWLWILAGAVGGALVGYAVGYSRRAEEAAILGSNLAIATMAVTIELTYGEEFLSDLVDEANTIMAEYPDLIVEKAKQMHAFRALRELMDKKGVGV